MSDNYLQVVKVAKNSLPSLSDIHNIIERPLPTELLNAYYTKIIPGMISKSDSYSGDVKLTESFNIEPNTDYINGFQFETEFPTDVSKDKDFEQVSNDNNFIYFVIIVGRDINAYDIIQTYSTTGNIYYNHEHKVIYTSANSFFKIVNENSEYVPHWSPVSIEVSGTASAPSTPTINAENIAEISKLITSQTGNVSYYLNCLSNAFDNVSITDSDVLKYFLSILMVEIKLDKTNYDLNRNFLKKMNEIGIKTDVIKEPVKHMLGKMSDAKNPYQIYINGLDFPLLLLKMGKGPFDSIINPTYANYYKLLSAAKTYFEKSDNKDAKALIKLLLKNVQTKTQCAECFVIFNSRRNVNGGKINERFKYKLEQNNGRVCIKMEAAKSMTRLYDKDGIEIPDAQGTPEDKQRFIEEKGKKVINIDGKGNRNLKGIFGPFRKVYETKDSNSDIAKSPEMNELLRKLINEGILFIIGWGASGAGKTSKLVYFNKGETRDEQIGVIIQMCNLFKTTYGNKVGDRLIVKRVEVCPEPKNEDEYQCEQDKDSYIFNWTNNDFLCGNKTEFYAKNPERLKREKVECAPQNQTDEIKNYQGCNISGKLLGEVAELLIDKDRHVNATTNNQNSSRSHSLLFLKFEYNNDKYVEPKVIVIGDFAGVENIFSCDDLQVYIDFANLNVDKTMKDIEDPGYVERKYYNGVDVDETRDNIYKFMEGENLYQYIGDKKGGGNSNVNNNINVTKEQWVKNLKTMLKHCDSEKSPTNCFLKNYANENNYNQITRIKNLFQPPNANIEYPIVGQIRNASTIFNAQKNGLTLPQVSGWYDRGTFIPTGDYNLQDNYNYKKTLVINLYEVKNFFLGQKSYFIKTTVNEEQNEKKDKTIKNSNTQSKKTSNPYAPKGKSDKSELSGTINECNGLTCEYYKYEYGEEFIYCHKVDDKYNITHLIIDNRVPGNNTGVKFTMIDNNTIKVHKLSSSSNTGVTQGNSIILKQQSKPDLNVLGKTFTVPGFVDSTVVNPTDQTFDNYKNQTNETLKDDIENWKTGTSTSISFYAIGITNYNGKEYKLPVQVIINKPYDSFATPSNDQDQQLANKIVEGWVNIKDASKINEAKQQFQTDLDILYGEINRHAQVKEVAQKYCNLRKKEGIFINNELALLTKAVDACYSLKNSGQPLMPKNIPGVNDFFEGRHIFKVLDKVVYDVDSFKKVVDNSMIMKAIFDTCGSLDIFPKKINDNQMRAGSTEPEPQNKLENYTSFSKMLSVVYFLVFDLSRSAEKDNKIQYIDINPLFDLLTKVEYDMELEEFGMDFNAEKQIYINKITNTKTDIEKYFVSNGISTSTTVTPNTTLKSNVDVSSMFKAIEDEMKKVNAANSYPEFHIALLGLIETIDKTNMTTSIGTLHTVSRRMNGIKKLTIHPEQRTAQESEISIAQTKQAIQTSNSNNNIPSQSTLKEYNIPLRQTTNESTISSRQTPKESNSEFRAKPLTPLNDVVTNASNINKNEKGIYRTKFENSVAKQHVSENTPSLRRNATFSNLNANNSNLNFEKYLKK